MAVRRASAGTPPDPGPAGKGICVRWMPACGCGEPGPPGLSAGAVCVSRGPWSLSLEGWWGTSGIGKTQGQPMGCPTGPPTENFSIPFSVNEEMSQCPLCHLLALPVGSFSGMPLRAAPRGTDLMAQGLCRGRWAQADVDLNPDPACHYPCNPTRVLIPSLRASPSTLPYPHPRKPCYRQEQQQWPPERKAPGDGDAVAADSHLPARPDQRKTLARSQGRAEKRMSGRASQRQPGGGVRSEEP